MFITLGLLPTARKPSWQHFFQPSSNEVQNEKVGVKRTAKFDLLISAGDVPSIFHPSSHLRTITRVIEGRFITRMTTVTTVNTLSDDK